MIGMAIITFPHQFKQFGIFGCFITHGITASVVIYLMYLISNSMDRTEY